MCKLPSTNSDWVRSSKFIAGHCDGELRSFESRSGVSDDMSRDVDLESEWRCNGPRPSTNSDWGWKPASSRFVNRACEPRDIVSGFSIKVLRYAGSGWCNELGGDRRRPGCLLETWDN